MELTETLRTFVGACDPFPFPAPWHRLPAPHCYCGIAQPDQTLERLLATCTIEDLQQAGVLLPDSDPPKFHPALLGAEQLFLVKSDADGNPTGLLTVEGPLPSSESDQHAVDRLFVVQTVTEWALLNSLGFNASLVHQVALEQFGYRVHDVSPAATAESVPPSERPEIVLTGWSPLQLSLDADGWQALAASLLESAWHGEADLSRVCVWQPTSRVLDALRFALRSGRCASLANQLLSSSETDLFVPAVLNPELPATDPALSVDVAYHRLFMELQAGPDFDDARRARATRDYLVSVHFDIVMPLMREAQSEPNLILRAYRLLLANYMQTFHEVAPFVGRISRPGFVQPKVNDLIRLGRQTLTVIKPIETSGFDGDDRDDEDDE